MRFSGLVLLASLALSLTACTNEFSTVTNGAAETQVPAEKRAPETIADSFSLPNTDSCQKASCITIQKKSLGKIFLLLASGKTAGSTPQWYDLKPLVVSFEKSGARLALLGENYTSIYSEIKTVNLIQTFEVVSEDADTVTFDWGSGLKTFVLQSSYDVDDVRATQNGLTESAFDSLPVIDSFIRGIKFDDKNIELEQISKIRTDGIKSDGKKINFEVKEETLAMNIQIRAYDPGKNFQPKEADKQRRAGFFVTKISKPGMSTEVSNLITKWDLSDEKGPIVVRISSAVPADYVDAVAEGALYWNKVFGKDVIVVKKGVDPQAGPEDRSIFIRWIPWLDSGAAYAIGQSDPLTGEVLRAQVFMPSVFTRVGTADMVDLNAGNPVAVGAVACDLGHVFTSLQEIAREATDSQRLRLAQDSVRSTVAHEMGHALGMRHNFAGSYSAKVSAHDIRETAKTYLKDPTHRGLETSTSIMDYVGGIDNILMAAKLKNSPLSYDKMAMDWAYAKNDNALNPKISLYCTDDDIALATSQGLQVYGCERFDLGNNPLLRKALDAQDERTNFVKVLFASILGRRYPAETPSEVKDLKLVILESARWAALNTNDLKFVSQAILEPTKNAAPAPVFMSLTALKTGQILQTKAGVDAAMAKERLRSLSEINGYPGLLNALWRNADGTIATHWLQDQIEELKNSPYFVSGKTLGGREYQLSAADQKDILAFFEGLVATNRKTLATGLATLLPKPEEKDAQAQVLTAYLPKDLVGEVEANSLFRLYLDLLDAKDGSFEAVIGSSVAPGVTKTVTLPKRFLTEAERIQWGRLVSTRLLRFDVEMKKALVLQASVGVTNSVLTQIDPGLDITLEEKPADVSDRLLKAGLLDANAAAWLKAEINTWMALKAMP